MRPRRPSGRGARPLNFTVRSPAPNPMHYWFSLGRSRWFGATLHVHLSVVILVAIVALAAIESPTFAAVTLLSYLGLILLHEWGHAAVAHYFGYDVKGIWLGAIHC